jgi:hypothetical protein
MAGGVLHLFVERVDGLKVYANFHDQASIIGVALDDASNILAVEVIHVTSLKNCFTAIPDFSRVSISIYTTLLQKLLNRTRCRCARRGSNEISAADMDDICRQSVYVF